MKQNLREWDNAHIGNNSRGRRIHKINHEYVLYKVTSELSIHYFTSCQLCFYLNTLFCIFIIAAVSDNDKASNVHTRAVGLLKM